MHLELALCIGRRLDTETPAGFDCTVEGENGKQKKQTSVFV